MKFDFCLNIDDPDTGKTIFPDIEGEVDCCLDWDVYGHPFVCATAVYVNGVNLYQSQMSMFRQAAAFVAEKVENDRSILSDLLADAREVA